MKDSKKVRAIAFYLPQFHPTKENDEWWGKGFTEWTNVAKARPLFKGHYQPHIPADLGFYDLRLSESREAQAELAEKYGIEGFCYWHYWFGGGKRLLERPFTEVLSSGKPNFPFCLAWANHSWKKKLWDPNATFKDKLLVEQTYPGDEDIKAHFYTVLPAFKDKRYITINECPLFLIYAPLDYKEVSHFMEIWRKLAVQNGLKGIYFVGQGNMVHRKAILALGFNAFNDASVFGIQENKNDLYLVARKIVARLFKYPISYRYADAMKYRVHSEAKFDDTIPTIIPNWDHSPRSGAKGVILTGATPQLFRKHVEEIINLIKDKKEEERIVFVKSWNEWGEGNYLEPDLQYGDGHLTAFRSVIESLKY
ncbi:glycoside hydrolase family 99-like domain-containing protein [Bacteroides cellulosilyticus]|uniref:glycoside hydrolase family 99-like domain-containing protein n=1 Tax=Bacteroides cellulosilyticus TaxID=246787 RepID=UPI0034A5069F